MESFFLDHQNPVFTIRGSEEKMSVEILKVSLIASERNEPLQVEILKVSLIASERNEPLQLVVTDENGLVIYFKTLIPKPPEPDAVRFNRYPEVPVNKRFIFNEKLQIHIAAPGQSKFAVEVQWV